MKTNLAIVAGLLLTVASPELAACAGKHPTLSVKEANFSVRDQQPFWLDNTHILFHGYAGSEGIASKGSDFLNEGWHAWDIERETVLKDMRFEHAQPECINGQTKSYVLRYSIDGTISKRRAFVNGEEVPLPDRVWVNPRSCRALTIEPPWIVDGHTSSSKVPLLEEHGYIDRGPDGEDLRTKLPMLYYRTGDTQPISLGLESRRVEPLVTYYPFVDAYLLQGDRSTFNAPSLWLLHPDGTVEQIFDPGGKAWTKQSWAWLVLTKLGLVFTSLHPAGPHSADAGLYLWKDGVLARVGMGYFSWGAVSPDGCKLAIIKHRRDPHLRGDERQRLQVVNVCDGGSHVN